jgi:hypothetical protein
MPFTAAHPALVLPILRWRNLSATGLVVGSLSPDFEYFLKMSVLSRYSHMFWGLFYFDLPVTLCLAIIFHVVVKRPLIDNLPAWISERFDTLYALDFVGYLRSHFASFMVSALIGAASHIIWDSFTHAHGFVVQRFPFFVTTIIPYDGARYPLYYALQHFSTGIGLVCLMWYLWRIPRTVFHRQPATWSFWPLLVLVAIVLLVLRFSGGWREQIGNQVVSVISASLAGLTVSGWWHKTKSAHG